MSAIQLPDVQNVLRISKAIAVLDAILSPEWLYRYYSFNSKWSPDEQMASMRDGCGDGYFILFNQHGAILKGYAHECEAAKWCVEHGKPMPGMFDGMPAEFQQFLTEPAFSINDTTYCFWRRHRDPAWSCGSAKYDSNSDGGASEQLTILQGDPNYYARWAREYFEQPVEESAVRQVYENQRLSESLAKSLNPDIDFELLRRDIEEIAYGA